MALAAFKLVKCTGTNAGTETDCSKHPCFLSADIVSTDTGSYPIAAPLDAVSGPNYSYENWLRWECTAAPDNYCQNFKYWGPNHQPDHEDNPGNKMTVLLGTTGTGATPTDNASSVATVTQHNNYYSEGTALAVGVEPGDNKIDAVGEKTDYLVPQLKVEYQVAQGNMESQVHLYSYEEV